MCAHTTERHPRAAGAGLINEVLETAAAAETAADDAPERLSECRGDGPGRGRSGDERGRRRGGRGEEEERGKRRMEKW